MLTDLDDDTAALFVPNTCREDGCIRPLVHRGLGVCVSHYNLRKGRAAAAVCTEPWPTVELAAEIRFLRAGGRSLRSIAEALQIEPRQIEQRLTRAGLARDAKPWRQLAT